MGRCYKVPFKHGNNMYFMSYNRSTTLERSVNRLLGSLNMLYCARFYLSIYLSISLSIYVESSSLIHRRSYP